MKTTVKYNKHELVKPLMKMTEDSWREEYENMGEDIQDIVTGFWKAGIIALIVEVE